MQAPMAFAGSHASKDESQIVQPPIAFSGRSRTHRLVEVRQIVTSMAVCQCLKLWLPVSRLGGTRASL